MQAKSTNRKPSQRAIEREARRIASGLIDALPGSRNDPKAWIRLANSCGACVFSHDSLELSVGMYHPAVSDIGQAAIIYCRALPARLQCLVLVHEVAHFQQRPRVHHADIEAYDTSAGDRRHDIARMVESLVFPGIRRSATVRTFQDG